MKLSFSTIVQDAAEFSEEADLEDLAEAEGASWMARSHSGHWAAAQLFSANPALESAVAGQPARGFLAGPAQDPLPVGHEAQKRPAAALGAAVGNARLGAPVTALPPAQEGALAQQSASEEGASEDAPC